MRDKPPKSTRTQGGDPIADYIRADTRLPAYLPYPRFLLKMEISQTAKLLYSLLLDRSTLSQKNKWLDDEGRIYIIYPIAEIAEICLLYTSGASGTEPVEGNLQGQCRYHHRQYGFPYFSWRFGADYAERAESGTGKRND